MGPISATGLPRSVTTIRSPRPTRRKYALSSFFRTRTETFMINVATMATSGGQHMPAVNQPDLQVSQATAHLWSPMSSRGCATRGSDDAPPPADAPALDRKPRRAGSDAEPHRTLSGSVTMASRLSGRGKWDIRERRGRSEAGRGGGPRLDVLTTRSTE